ncbi:hypothetical protein HOLleu_04372 [Holothuria leucospilota]|uniref:CCHC-type domain-containing protein n=1 Tax=Holothuria leucospilota TaxID=206669 RepID=A0A9Q1CSV4_HOLLE|nr:hypothetical protein HOLleu_04372 [Holothuria leucospilota]
MDRSTGSRGSADFRSFLEGLRGHSDSDWMLVDQTFDRQSTSSLQLSEASGERRAPSRRSPTNSLGDLGWRVPEETQSPKRQNTNPFVEREPPGNPFTSPRRVITVSLTQGHQEVDSDMRTEEDLTFPRNACWSCGKLVHFKRDCPEDKADIPSGRESPVQENRDLSRVGVDVRQDS